MKHLTHIFLVTLLLPGVAFAHHSTAEYDRTQVTEIEGIVKRVIWRNPHVGLDIEVENIDGSTTRWVLESMDLNSQNRREVTKELLNIGESVKAAGYASTKRPDHMFVYNILTTDGTEIVTHNNGERRWQNSNLVGAVQPTETLASQINATSIFKTWQVDRQGIQAFPENLPLTDAAIAKKAGWNSAYDFTMNCVSPGLPHSMVSNSPHPYAFYDEGDTIVIKGEYFDIYRTVYMNEATMPTNLTAALQGISTGHWEGDSLIINTSDGDWPWLDLTGTPLSREATFVERITPSADGMQLTYSIRVNDPVNFSEVIESTRTWSWRPELEVQHYGCALPEEA